MIVLFLLACSDYDLHLRGDNFGDAASRIEVDPLRLDFHTASAGEERRLPFTVHSVGTALLNVDDMVLESAGGFTLLGFDEPLALAPGSSQDFEVSFTPAQLGDHSGLITIRSNDDEAPEVEVELLGEGITPWLEISPPTYDFGSALIPCGDAVELTLQNTGRDDLLIDQMAYTSGEGQFALRDIDLPLTLPPGAYTRVWVDWEPGIPGTSTGVLEVQSNDPRGIVSASQTGAGEETGENSETFVVEPDPPVNLLFAVDQSGSMDDDAVSLGENFGTFIDAISAVTDMWRIGVVTYDDGCFNNGVLRSNTANYESLFAEAVSMGTDREILDDEALLSLVDRALQQTDNGDCNAGFLREGALLHVIVVSDEPERSHEQASAWTWDFFVNRYVDYVADPALLRISGVVDTETCNEGDAGYAEAIEATGGEALSICAGDWASYAASLAAASLSYAWTFPLSADPVASSIRVELDGVELSGGWRYEAGLNAVVLDAVSPGQQIDVHYALAAECL